MELFLILLSGICWTIAYLAMIYKGIKDKTYGMPLFALALNITWEGLYTYKSFTASPIPLHGWITFIWFLLDLIIVYTYIKYGKNEFAKHTYAIYFIPWSFIAFATAFILQYSFLLEFGSLAAGYSGFLQNLVMSVLFIGMLSRRKSAIGQNRKIAFCKWIGTLAPTILLGFIQGEQFLLVIGIFCSVFDLIYLYCLDTFKKTRKNKQRLPVPNQKSFASLKPYPFQVKN